MIQQHSVKFDCSFFFLTDAATTDIYTLSLHDALPILSMINASVRFVQKSIPLLISPVAFSAGPYTLKALRLFSHVKSSFLSGTKRPYTNGSNSSGSPEDIWQTAVCPAFTDTGKMSDSTVSVPLVTS